MRPFVLQRDRTADQEPVPGTACLHCGRPLPPAARDANDPYCSTDCAKAAHDVPVTVPPRE
jgi:hypothetical protein